MHRREFLKRSGLIGAAVAAGGMVPAAPGDEKPRPMPTIKIGDLEVSRLLLGTNPFFGFAHRPGEIGGQMKSYYTDEKIMEKAKSLDTEKGSAGDFDD